MKRYISIILSVIICVATISCTTQAETDSFTSEKTSSYDNKYYAIQKSEVVDGVHNIVVYVYLTDSNELVSSFSPAGAVDFKGICREKDSYNIWTESADIGIFCYEYSDDKWKINKELELPEYIKTRYEYGISTAAAKAHHKIV